MSISTKTPRMSFTFSALTACARSPASCEYTQAFAREHIAVDRCDTFGVQRAVFNYDSQTWETRSYFLPRLSNDFVLLTPLDMLTRDETWINRKDMIGQFELPPAAVPNAELRQRINAYFASKLGRYPDAKRRRTAAAQTIAQFPELIDRYIKLQEKIALDEIRGEVADVVLSDS